MGSVTAKIPPQLRRPPAPQQGPPRPHPTISSRMLWTISFASTFRGRRGTGVRQSACSKKMLFHVGVADASGRSRRKHLAKLLDEVIARGAAVGATPSLPKYEKCALGLSSGESSIGASAKVSRVRQTKQRAIACSQIPRSLSFGAERGELGFPFGPIVRLLILTGQRRDEVGGLSWAEIDLASSLWTLPAARSKNRREHTVPLSPAVIEILQALPRFERWPFIFSSGANPPSGFGKAKGRLDLRACPSSGGVFAAKLILSRHEPAFSSLGD